MLRDPIRLRVLVHPALAREPWPGPLGLARTGVEKAAVGEVWGGLPALLDVLETALGLGGPTTDEVVRAARFVSVLRDNAGFWSSSLVVDPQGVAETVLAWRDQLVLGGWDAVPVPGESKRLLELAGVEDQVPPGLPDRVAAVLDALAHRKTPIHEVVLVEPVEFYPLLWRFVLMRLVEQQVVLRGHKDGEPPRDSTDLHRLAVGEHIRPDGDGSLQLVRAPDPCRAADDLAAWLAARNDTRGDLDGVLIVGGDSILDGALQRHGLPTLGRPAPTATNLATLQVLPLSLALAWRPADPRAMLELLSLPLSPVPNALRWRLARALQHWPGIGNQKWNDAFVDGLAAIEDEGRRERVRKRLDVLLSPVADADSVLQTADVVARIDAFAEWLNAVQILQEVDVAPALEQVRLLRAILEARPDADCSRSGIDLLLAAVGRAMQSSPRTEAQVGLQYVDQPDAVLAPCPVIIWWDFHRDTAPVPPRVPWSPAELDYLAARGVAIASPSVARRQSERWNRPLRLASESLLLICPRTDATGEPGHPHPLWDEISARLTDGAEALARDVPASPEPLATEVLAPLVLPTAPGSFAIGPGQVAPRDAESATSLGKLVSCGSQWVFEYQAGLRRSPFFSLPAENLLFGNLLHLCFAEMLPLFDATGGLAAIDAAVDTVLQFFDAQLPSHAGALAQPRARAACARLRRILEGAARDFTGLLHRSQLRIEQIEKRLERSVRSPWQTIAGRPDAILVPVDPGSTQPPVIVDFKFGGKHEDHLHRGTAYQLATYCFLATAESERFPDAAYYILSTQRLPTTSLQFAEVRPVESGTPLLDTWRSLLAAADKSFHALALGEIVVPNPKEKPQLADGELVLAPGCRFCDFGVLCGVDLPDPEAEGDR